ncbi:MAG TPA: hypothetical protein VK614_09070 [Allosphingosinicella sp.]|nr:hypothetical protein [Allosphingosinicella sp.]
MLLFAALLALAAPPAAFLREEETPLLHFRYGWPAAAEAVPSLRAGLRREMAAARRWAIARATEGRRNARRMRLDYVQQDYDQVWEAAGATPQLLSLVSGTFALSGGAHGDMSVSALLWDLAADRAVDARALLGPALAGMTGHFCAELDRQRAENRGALVRPDPTDPFSRCPPLAEQVIAPADDDGNGRFETLRVLLPPYVAGPYVEGDYAVDIPVAPEDLARVPDRYQPIFEVAGQR